MASRKPPFSAKLSNATDSQIQAEAELASFIAKFEPKYAHRIKDCRKELRSIFPEANELVYDHYNFFVIGYCSSERALDCIVSIAAAANGKTEVSSAGQGKLIIKSVLVKQRARQRTKSAA